MKFNTFRIAQHRDGKIVFEHYNGDGLDRVDSNHIPARDSFFWHYPSEVYTPEVAFEMFRAAHVERLEEELKMMKLAKME